MYEGKILFFDFDGTIANTEMYHRSATRKALDKYNVTIDLTKFFGIGRKNYDFFLDVKKKYHLNFPIDNVISLKNSIFKKIASDVRPYIDIETMVRHLPNQKYLITNNYQDVVQFFLKKWNMNQCFQRVISLSNENTGKTEKILSTGYSPDLCVLFDDNFDTIIHAIDNGIHGVWIQNGKICKITNEEWLDTIPLEQKACWMEHVCKKALNDTTLLNSAYWEVWMKLPYTKNTKEMRF